jgi:hypothetical protein
MKKLIFLFLFLSFQFVFALTITEIMYNPDGNDIGREWIEVFNNLEETVNIISGKKGWKINDGANHIFKENLSVSPREIFVIVQDKSLFLKDYPNFQGKMIQANFSLKNESGKIQIFDEQKRLRSEISYQSSCGGNSNGYSIFFENNVCKENKIKGGTPGNLLVKDEEEKTVSESEKLSVLTQTAPTLTPTALIPVTESKTSTSTPIATTVASLISILATSSISTSSLELENVKTFKPTLIISEFLPNPKGNDQDNEFIEIYNYGDELIDLNGFILEIGKKKIKLKGKIEPKEYFVISNKDNNFYIRNSGETLKLYFDNQAIFSISYDGKAPEGESFSRKDNGLWSFTQPTPGKENLFLENKNKQENISEVPERKINSLSDQVYINSYATDNYLMNINNEKSKIVYIIVGLIVILILIFLSWLRL